MDLELSDDQRALQESVRDFLSTECPVSLVRQVVEEDKGAEQLWQKMVELDWPGLLVEEDAGGLGMGFVELAVVTEQLGRCISPAPFMSSACHFTSALRLAATDDQRRRFLGPVASEGMVGTVAVAEAAGSYEPTRTQTEARRDGDGFVITGEKHFVLDATRAQEIVVTAKLRGRQERDDGGHDEADGQRPVPVGLFVVPQALVHCEPLDSFDPTRQYSTVTIGAVKVGADRFLTRSAGAGAGAAAHSVIGSVLEECTAAMACELVGTSQAMFDIVHAYVLEREQFGVKIGSFQAIKHKLADMYVALESARALSYFAALCIAENDERRALAVSMAKSSAGDCQKLIAQQSIQCLGGIGYTWEHDIHLFVKRAKATAALFGNAAQHREKVATALGLGAVSS